MANPVEGNHITFKQGADLRGKRGYALMLSSGKAVLATGGTVKIIGTLASEPDSSSTSEMVDVAVRNGNGIRRGIAGGNIAVDDYVTSDANGKLIATTTAGNEVVGQAIEVATDGKAFNFLPCHFRY